MHATPRPPEGPRYRPYDLLVVPREAAARAPEYFTVIANGVIVIRYLAAGRVCGARQLAHRRLKTRTFGWSARGW